MISVYAPKAVFSLHVYFSVTYLFSYRDIFLKDLTGLGLSELVDLQGILGVIDNALILFVLSLIVFSCPIMLVSFCHFISVCI